MKKLFIATITAVSLVEMQAVANVSLHIDAAFLYDNTGVNYAPVTTVGLWIVDTSGGSSLSPELFPGESIAQGTTLAGTTDKILVATDGTAADSPGYLGFDFGPSAYPTGFAGGQKFGIIWLVNQSLSVTTFQGGCYGEFSDYAGAYSNPWTLAPDPTALETYDMSTVAAGGSVPEWMGIANLQIIPEPSSIMLVVVGLLGCIGLIRRHR